MKKKKLKDYLFYKTMLGIQYQGHVLDILKLMPDESINCFIMSPPYWGLRDYKIKTQIWDDPGNCKHIWKIKEYKNPKACGSAKKARIGNTKKGLLQFKIKEGFCKKCNAWSGSLGLEPNFNLYMKHLIQIFVEIKRVLKKDGTCFVNLGDNYNNQGKGYPVKCLNMIPFRFSIAMIDELGWILRNVIIWDKPNAMPESVKDRFSVSHDYIFFFVKSQHYFFQQQFIPLKEVTKERYKRKWDGNKDRNDPYSKITSNFDTWMNMTDEEIANIPGRNMTTVWKVGTKANKFSKNIHFAVFPEKLVVPMIK